MTGSAWRPSCTATTICGSHSPPLLAPLQLRDEEDLATRPDRLVIADLVDLAVDRDRGLLDQMLAEPRIELVHRLDDAAQVLGLDLELAHTAGVAPAETGSERDPRRHQGRVLPGV